MHRVWTDETTTIIDPDIWGRRIKHLKKGKIFICSTPAMNKNEGEKMTKELQEKKKADLVETEEVEGYESFDEAEIQIPKVLLMQKTSKLVDAEKSKLKVGDFVDSLTKEVIGSKEKPIKFIPFGSNKTWIIEIKKEKKFIYFQTLDRTPRNEDLGFEEVIEGVTYRRTKNQDLMVILPDQLKKEDVAIPYLISFKNTGLRAIKSFNTFLMKLKLAKQPQWAGLFELGAERQENDEGSWLTFVTKRVGNSTAAEMEQARNWYLIFKESKKNFKVVDNTKASAPTEETKMDEEIPY